MSDVWSFFLCPKSVNREQRTDRETNKIKHLIVEHLEQIAGNRRKSTKIKHIQTKFEI